MNQQLIDWSASDGTKFMKPQDTTAIEADSINAKRDEAYDVAKERARIAIHDSHELETNEHDFAFMDGFDAGADFALSLNQWVEIRSEEDLPKESDSYLFYYKGGRYEVFSFKAKPEQGEGPLDQTDKQYMVENYSAWMLIPPFVPAPETGETK